MAARQLLFTEEQLQNTPSRKDGVDVDTEQRYRREAFVFISRVGAELELQPTTFNTGIVFFHRFFMHHSFKDLAKYRFLIAAASLFVGGKVEEQPKKLKDFVPVVYENLPRKPTEDAFKVQRDIHAKILGFEKMILETLTFDLVVRHPFRYLIKTAQKLKVSNDLVQQACDYLMSSYQTTLCLQYPAQTISIGLLQLAGETLKVQLELKSSSASSTNTSKAAQPSSSPWWQPLNPSLTVEETQDVCRQMKAAMQQEKKPSKPSPLDPVQSPFGESPNSATPSSRGRSQPPGSSLTDDHPAKRSKPNLS